MDSSGSEEWGLYKVTKEYLQTISLLVKMTLIFLSAHLIRLL